MTEREQFESEAQGINLKRRDNGVYVSSAAQFMWEGWQMRAAIDRKPTPGPAAIHKQESECHCDLGDKFTICSGPFTPDNDGDCTNRVGDRYCVHKRACHPGASHG